MTSINVNTQGINARVGLGAQPKAEKEVQQEKAQAVVAEQKQQVSPDKVLNYLAQSAVVVAPKTINPAKYVDEASQKRIEGFMAQFEDIVATNLEAISKEFPKMSANAKMKVALAQVDNKETPQIDRRPVVGQRPQDVISSLQS